MSIIVPTYAYTYIRIEFLKKIIMDNDTLKEFKEINQIQDAIDFINPYYPDLNVEKYIIEEIENSLYNVFIKIIGRILTYSPKNMRNFLKNFLVQYEIMNIKQIILGTIIGKSKEEKSKNINFLVEVYLENMDFIKSLLDLSSVEEIRLFMRGTKYYEAVREGILYFKNNSEIFVLESFLDQLFYRNLKNAEKDFNSKEKALLSLFINAISEVYNINIIYRGILNKIEINLLSQFLVENYLFLNRDTIQNLLNQRDIDSFIALLEKNIRKIEEFKTYYKKTPINKEHLYWWLEGLYIDYFFTKFKLKIDDIEYLTIYRIIEVIIKKQKEIKFDILPHIISILHEKYDLLKFDQKSLSKLE
jgi:vacuolar-type H+-ATPase subunit C/Vma6